MHVNPEHQSITITTGPEGPDGQITVYITSLTPYPGERGDIRQCVKRWQYELDAGEWSGDHWEAVHNVSRIVAGKVLDDRYREHPRKCSC